MFLNKLVGLAVLRPFASKLLKCLCSYTCSEGRGLFFVQFLCSAFCVLWQQCGKINNSVSEDVCVCVFVDVWHVGHVTKKHVTVLTAGSSPSVALAMLTFSAHFLHIFLLSLCGSVGFVFFVCYNGL